MEEAPENGKELSHSAHANGMEWMNWLFYALMPSGFKNKVVWLQGVL